MYLIAELIYIYIVQEVYISCCSLLKIIHHITFIKLMN